VDRREPALLKFSRCPSLAEDRAQFPSMYSYELNLPVTVR